MIDFWNKRYAAPQFAYGEEPNDYFRRQLQKIPAGKLLMPAEGEGRNAVFAAKEGWEVFAFDMAGEGRAKAQKLADKNHVSIDYQVGEFSEITLPPNHFDAIGLIYAHFPASLRSKYHEALGKSLRPGGMVILEAFSKSHLTFNSVNEKAGGPKDINMLFSVEEVENDFRNYDILELIEEEVILHEGLYHDGRSAVVRFVGKKR